MSAVPSRRGRRHRRGRPRTLAAVPAPSPRPRRHRLHRLLRRRHGLGGPLYAALALAVLGVGLAALLLLNTTAAQDAFRLHRLQQRGDALVQEEQQLRVALLQDQSPYRLSARAMEDGLRPAPEPRFMHVGR